MRATASRPLSVRGCRAAAAALHEGTTDRASAECGPAPGGNPKKACKNCSCGLAEEESKAQAAQVEESRKKVVNTAQVKSSCGNVHTLAKHLLFMACSLCARLPCLPRSAH